MKKSWRLLQKGTKQVIIKIGKKNTNLLVLAQLLCLIISISFIKTCKLDLSCASGGSNDIKKHIDSLTHKQKSKSIEGNYIWFSQYAYDLFHFLLVFLSLQLL